MVENTGYKCLGSLKDNHADFPTRLCGEAVELLWTAVRTMPNKSSERRQLGPFGVGDVAPGDFADPGTDRRCQNPTTIGCVIVRNKLKCGKCRNGTVAWCRRDS